MHENSYASHDGNMYQNTGSGWQKQTSIGMKPEFKSIAVAVDAIPSAVAFTAMPAITQEITGVPDSPDATTTIDGRCLPPPLQPHHDIQH